tara:strand:+ start:33 stop:1283 length:1251 start_codon:yes stop_codon:yes gene_type:complete
MEIEQNTKEEDKFHEAMVYRLFRNMRLRCRENNSRLVSVEEEYQGPKGVYSYRCDRGHTWEKSWTAQVSRKHWCPICLEEDRKARHLNRLKQHLQKYGFRLVDESWSGVNSNYSYVCCQGHALTQSASRILNASVGCPDCDLPHPSQQTVSQIIANIQTYAAKNSLTVVADHYITSETELDWTCPNGHVWQESWKRRSKKSGCPTCNRATVTATATATSKVIRSISGEREIYARMESYALEKGGQLLSPEYVPVSTKAHWQCKHGHKWLRSWKNERSFGAWCPICSRARQYDEIVRKMRDYASINGGRLIEAGRTPTDNSLWECGKGHQWATSWRNIRNHRGWCRLCKIRSDTSPQLRMLQEYAVEREGKLLSTEYLNSKSKYRWQCSKGHTWERSWNSTKQRGLWCPHCGRQRSR